MALAVRCFELGQPAKQRASLSIRKTSLSGKKLKRQDGADIEIRRTFRFQSLDMLDGILSRQNKCTQGAVIDF